MSITNTEYWKEIKTLATDMVSESITDNNGDVEAAKEEIQDTRLHETVDSHQWVIYYSYNLDVIQHSNNSDYMIDNFGDEQAGQILANDGLDSLHTAIAFWAMYADIQEYLDDEFNEHEELNAAAV